MNTLPTRIYSLAAVLILPVLLSAQTGQTSVPVPANPSVLIVSQGSCPVDVGRKLVAAGFSLNRMNGLEDRPLTWEEARKYNVIVVSELGRANADMTLPPGVKQTIETLRRFLDAGGGVFMMPIFGQMATDKPTQDAFLKPLGLTPLFDEFPMDAETSVVGTPWNIPFAFTNVVTESPVTARVSGLWYPVPQQRIGGQNHCIPLQADDTWSVVIKGGKSSKTMKGPLQQDPTGPGSYSSSVPLVATKQVGKGRMVVVGITPEYLLGRNAMTTLGGIVLDRGLRGVPSGGYQLIENSLKWLAEPSSRDTSLGGGAT